MERKSELNKNKISNGFEIKLDNEMIKEIPRKEWKEYWKKQVNNKINDIKNMSINEY
mgnify:CR=1 FL=1